MSKVDGTSDRAVIPKDHSSRAADLGLANDGGLHLVPDGEQADCLLRSTPTDWLGPASEDFDGIRRQRWGSDLQKIRL